MGLISTVNLEVQSKYLLTIVDPLDGLCSSRDSECINAWERFKKFLTNFFKS